MRTSSFSYRTYSKRIMMNPHIEIIFQLHMVLISNRKRAGDAKFLLQPTEDIKEFL